MNNTGILFSYPTHSFRSIKLKAQVRGLSLRIFSWIKYKLHRESSVSDKWCKLDPLFMYLRRYFLGFIRRILFAALKIKRAPFPCTATLPLET